MGGIYDQHESIRDRALEVLSPFGFEDCNDGENPALIWHPELNRSFDVSATDPHKIVMLVAETYTRVGYGSAQQEIRNAMGIP